MGIFVGPSQWFPINRNFCAVKREPSLRPNQGWSSQLSSRTHQCLVCCPCFWTLSAVRSRVVNERRTGTLDRGEWNRSNWYYFHIKNTFYRSIPWALTNWGETTWSWLYPCQGVFCLQSTLMKSMKILVTICHHVSEQTGLDRGTNSGMQRRLVPRCRSSTPCMMNCQNYREKPTHARMVPLSLVLSEHRFKQQVYIDKPSQTMPNWGQQKRWIRFPTTWRKSPNATLLWTILLFVPSGSGLITI